MSRLVIGLQAVREAIRAHGATVERVLVEQGPNPKLDAVGRFARDQGIVVETVPRGELDRVTRNGRHQGVVAWSPDLALVTLEQVIAAAPRLVVALDSVMDPQNFGAVLRSAVALGADAILWPEHGSAPLSTATFRASAGAVEHARLCRVPSLVHALEELTVAGLVAVGLDASATADLASIDLSVPVTLVVGAEDRGLHRGVRRACAHLARLPMAGPIASLNASVAAGIALYEVARQRAPRG